MDAVLETPSKRRKTEHSQAYDSQDDSGDELFEGHETVATVPLPDRTFSPPSYITQPTQILNRDTQGTPNSVQKPPVVQVAASSPARAPTTVSSPPSATVVRNKSSAVASMMAPAGTSFRAPMGITMPPQVIDLSDDEGPLYRGGSSDEEPQRSKADILPTTFIQPTKNKPSTDNVKKASGNISRVREITAGPSYQPLDPSQNASPVVVPAKRSADVMANAYGSSSRPAKQIQQVKSAKAQIVQDLSLDDIEDFQLRRKVERLRAIYSHHTVSQCKRAIVEKKGNVEDASELLASRDPNPLEIDLTTSDNDQQANKAPAPLQKASVKKQTKPPVKSIQERWAGTQSLSKSSQRPLPSSPSSPVAAPPKARKRLVQAKNRSTPRAEISDAPIKAPSPPPKRAVSLDSDESDSGLDLDEDKDPEIEGKVLNFFNNCSCNDLADIAAITEDVASFLLSRKPFKTLKDVRQVSKGVSGAGNRKPSTRKPIGDKIVDKCLDMWTGYEAVDELVKRCEALGKPVAEEMKRWGVDVFGASTNGELELVDINEHTSPGRDSGIGTPSSLSADEIDEGQVKKALNPRKKQVFATCSSR